MYAGVVLLLLAGLSCMETPQVGHGTEAGMLATGFTGEGGDAGASFALADTVFGRSFDSGDSIRLAFLRIESLYLPVIA
jgi:hypothetical protein